MYVCRFQYVVLRCPTPRLHRFLSSHWPSFKFLSFMAFLIPSIQFFFRLPLALFCFGIHFNAILGNLPSAILCTWPYHVSWFCSISFTIGSSNPICCIIVTFLILYFLVILEDLLRVLQFGGWVHGPAPHHPGEKLTHAIKPRQRLKKKDGLSNKRLYILLTLTVFVNIINVSTTHKIMNKPTRNKHPLFKIADDAPVHLPTPSTIRG